MYDIIELNGMKVADLREVAKELDIKKFDKLKKQDLIYKILDEQAIRPVQKGGSAKPTEAKPKPAEKAPQPVQAAQEKPAGDARNTERRPRKRAPQDNDRRPAQAAAQSENKPDNKPENKEESTAGRTNERRDNDR